jgi:hypothetical protein
MDASIGQAAKSLLIHASAGGQLLHPSEVNNSSRCVFRGPLSIDKVSART